MCQQSGESWLQLLYKQNTFICPEPGVRDTKSVNHPCQNTRSEQDVLETVSDVHH